MAIADNPNPSRTGSRASAIMALPWIVYARLPLICGHHLYTSADGRRL